MVFNQDHHEKECADAFVLARDGMSDFEGEKIERTFRGVTAALRFLDYQETTGTSTRSPTGSNSNAEQRSSGSHEPLVSGEDTNYHHVVCLVHSLDSEKENTPVN